MAEGHVGAGEKALVNKRPGCQPGTCPRRTPADLEEKILYLRQKYHFGPLRISWYLFRYHGLRITGGGVYQVLKRHGMNRLPRNQRRRSIPSRRYEKQVPGHHVQVDVKFLSFTTPSGKTVKRYQYTAIDDATRIRALKILSTQSALADARQERVRCLAEWHSARLRLLASAGQMGRFAVNE